MPIFISVSIGFLAFFIPVSSGERFGIGTTSLLTVFAIMFISKEGDPTVGAVSLQSVFYFSSMWFAVLPILATTIVYKMSSTNERDVAHWEICLEKLFDRCSYRQSVEDRDEGPKASEYGTTRCSPSPSSPSSPRSDVSIRRVWVMGRRKSIEVERTTSNGSTAGSTCSGINIVSSVFEPGTSRTKRETTIPTFFDSMLRNVHSVIMLHETIFR